MSILKTAIIASELLLPPKPQLWVPAAPAILRESVREVEDKKRLNLGSMLVNPFLVGAPAPIAPVFVGAQAGNAAGILGGTHSVSFALTGGASSTPQAGDLVVIAYMRGSALATNITAQISMVASPAATTVFQTSASGSSYKANYHVIYGFMAGTPATSFTVSGGASTTDGMAWALQCWRNINTSTVLDVTSTSQSFGAVTNDPPAITPVTDGAIIIGFGMSAGNLSSGSSGTPSGMLGAQHSWNNDTYDANVGVAYKVWATGGGAFNPPAYGGTGSASSVTVGVTVALRPA